MRAEGGSVVLAAYGPGQWETGSWVTRVPHCSLTASGVLGESHDEEPMSNVTIQDAGSTLHAPPLPAHFPSTPFWGSGDRKRQMGIRHMAPCTQSVCDSSARPHQLNTHIHQKERFFIFVFWYLCAILL